VKTPCSMWPLGQKCSSCKVSRKYAWGTFKVLSCGSCRAKNFKQHKYLTVGMGLEFQAGVQSQVLMTNDAGSMMSIRFKKQL
jgi:hypothetical protein